MSGLVNAAGTAKITFKLYSDAACTTEVFSSDSAFVTSNGNYTSGDYTTTAAGSYYWVASFPGDSNNEAASTACGDAGETSVVNKASPSITTSASGPVTVGATIHDTATMSGLVNAAGTAKITFKLYSDAACTTEVFSSDSAFVTGNGNYTSGDYTTTDRKSTRLNSSHQLISYAVFCL